MNLFEKENLCLVRCTDRGHMITIGINVISKHPVYPLWLLSGFSFGHNVRWVYMRQTHPGGDKTDRQQSSRASFVACSCYHAALTGRHGGEGGKGVAVRGAFPVREKYMYQTFENPGFHQKRLLQT